MEIICLTLKTKTMKLALLKGPLPGLRYRIAHGIGTYLDHFKYSHSNVVFKDGLSGSCWNKTGVDIRDINYEDGGTWDFYDLPGADEEKTREFYIRHLGMPYDGLGMMRFALGLLPESPTKFFCHELFAASQGWSDSWRYGPWLLTLHAKERLGAKLIRPPDLVRELQEDLSVISL